MSIPEPKVEQHEGRGVRSCPLFPELRTILEQLFMEQLFEELTIDGKYPSSESFVVNKPEYRAAAMCVGGWANANLRTQLIKILGRAGVAPWKRLFHSMRASRQTELERDFPRHVVCAWLGNTEVVAKKSYLLVTDADFVKASQKPEPKEHEKSGTKSGTVDCKSGTVGARTALHQNEESLVNHGINVTFPANYEASQMEVKGLEPMTSCMPCKRSPN